jgi:type IV secretion system protein TrbI
MPDQRDPRDLPASPDRLEEGIRGRVSGVTRIGPLGLGLAFGVIVLLLGAILYGVMRGSGANKNVAEVTPAPAPQASVAAQPLQIPTAPPQPMQSPPLLTAPNAQEVPNLSAAEGGPATPQPVAQTAGASAAQQAAERAAEEDLAARKSPLLAGNGQQIGAGANQGAAPANLQRQSPVNAPGEGQQPISAAANNNEFANGPTGQFAESNRGRVSGIGAGPLDPYHGNPLPQGGNSSDYLQALRYAPISPYEVLAGSVIPASLITGINSELPGVITAQIRQNVYDSKTGRYVLIPNGSRLVGTYQSGIAYGQTRARVVWTRLIFPDTSSIDLLNMEGNDTEGLAGLSGSVDNHFGQIWGNALLTSVLAAGLELSQAQSGSVLLYPTAGQIVTSQVGLQMAQLGQQYAQKGMNIPPTLHIPIGYPFVVMVDRDIVLPGPYGQGP